MQHVSLDIHNIDYWKKKNKPKNFQRPDCRFQDPSTPVTTTPAIAIPGRQNKRHYYGRDSRTTRVLAGNKQGYNLHSGDKYLRRATSRKHKQGYAPKSSRGGSICFSTGLFNCRAIRFSRSTGHYYPSARPYLL